MSIETERRTEVRIHIDRKPYESPNPTTGAALYELGKVGPHRELFREENGNQEDELVPNNQDKIHLTKDEHFYSEIDFQIIVNGQKKVVTTRELSFTEVVALAFPTPPTGQEVMFTVTYRKGPRKNPEGTLTEGHSVKIKNGMVFDVTPTNKS
jgi:hypothetical protein